jgi:hypothetical protein
MTLSGSATKANWQSALQSITYNNTSNTPNTSNRTINYLVNDGTYDSNTAAKTVSVTAVNDAPVNSVPAAQTTGTSAAKVFSTGNGNLISVSDAEAGSVQTQLVSTNGTTSLSGVTGLTFTVGDGTADATMTFSGTIANVNTALAGLGFTPTAAGAGSLQIVTSDLGSTGTGGTQTDNDTIAITVDYGLFTNAIDIGSVNGATSSSYASSVYTEVGSGDASGVNGTSDAFHYLYRSWTGDGTLIARVTGLTNSDGSAAASAMFRETTAAGSVEANIQVMPVGGSGGRFSHRPTTGATTTHAPFGGLAPTSWLKLVRSGNTFIGSTAPDSAGTPGTWTQRGTQSITMASTVLVGLATSAHTSAATTTGTYDSVSLATSVDPPVLTASGGTTAHTENVAVAVDSGITLTDTDNATMASGTVTIGTGYTAGQDVLAFTNQNGITGSYSAPTLTLTGSATTANWQSALRSITYNNTSDAPNTGNRTINFAVNDGTLGSNTAAKTVSVTAANDAPVNSVPGAQTASTGVAKVFSTGNGNLISISDADAASSSVQVQLVGTRGTTTLSGITGLTFTAGDGTADATMTFTGTTTNVNTALAGLAFNPTSSGAGSLQIITSDQGNTGTGGTLTDNDTVAITITTPCGGDLVTNGGFEGGTGWTEVGSSVVTTGGSVAARTGTWKAWLGGLGTDTTQSVSQSVTIPAGCTASLSYYLRITTAETSHPFDYFMVQANNTTLQTYSDSNAGASYVLRTLDLSAYAGQTITLNFLSDEDSSNQTSSWLDDVSLTLSP